MTTRMFNCLAAILTAGTLTACGGSSSGAFVPGVPPPPLPSNAAGIWAGSVSEDLATGDAGIIGVVTEANADARFLTDDGIALVLDNLGGTGGTLTATMTAYAPATDPFLDGSTVTTGTFAGTVVARTSLVGEWSLDSGDSGTVSMQYDALYERQSSIDLVFGFWLDSFDVLYSVDLNGVIFAQDAFGCVYDGTISIIDARFNVYALQMTVSNCPGVDGNYDGTGVLADAFGVADAFVVQLDSGEAVIADLLIRPPGPVPSSGPRSGSFLPQSP